MSRPPRASEGGAAAPAPQRWRWLRRVAGLLVAVSGAMLLVHTAPARGLVRRLVQAQVGDRLGGTVTLADLDYRLWAGTASATGIAARRPGLELDAQRAELHYGVGAGLTLRVVAPRVVVTPKAESPGGPDAGPVRPWLVLARLAQLEVIQGHLELRDERAEAWLRLSNVDSRLARGADGRLAGRVALPRSAVGWPRGGLRVEPVAAEADVAIDPSSGALEIARARLASGDTRLEASAVLERLSPITLKVEATGAIDARLFRRLQEDLEMEGGLDARLSFAHGAEGGSGSLVVETPDLSVTGVGPWRGRAQARFEGRRLVLETAEFQGYDGRLSASGDILLWDGRTELDVRAHEVDVAAFAATFAGFRPPLSSRADGALRLSLDDWELETLAGRGRLAFRPAEFVGWPISGPAPIALVGRRLDFASEALSARAAHGTLRGSLGFDKQLDLTYRLDVPRAEGLVPLLADAGVEAPPLALSGALRTEGSVEGRLPDWRAVARVSSEALAVEDVDLQVDGTVQMSAAGLEIESLVAHGAEAEATVSGFVPFLEEGVWQVRGDVVGVRLTDAFARHGVPVPTTATGSFSVTGPFATPQARFSLEAIAEPLAQEREANPPSPRSEASAAVGAESLAPVGSDAATAPDAAPALEAREAPPARERAVVRVSGSASPERAAIETAEAELGGGRATASGSWDAATGTIEVRFEAGSIDVRRLPWVPSALSDIGATLTAQATLSGKTAAPSGRARVVLGETAWKGHPFPETSLEAISDGSNVRLTGSVGGKPALDGRLPLERPWPLHLDVDLAALPWTEALRTLPAATADTLAVEGRLAVDIPLDEPAGLRYAAEVGALDLKLDRSWRAGPFRLRGGTSELAVEGFDLATSDGRLRVGGALGAAGAPGLTIDAELPLQESGRLLPGLALSGRSRATLRLTGPLREPEAAGQVELRDVSGRLGVVGFEAFQALARIEGGLLTLERATGRIAGGSITASGSLPLRPGDAPQSPGLTIEAKGLDAGTVLPAAPGAMRLATAIDVTARVEAREPGLAALRVEGELSRATVTAGSQRLDLDAPVRWRFAGGRLDPLTVTLAGPSGRLALEAFIDTGNGQPRASGRVSGTADLALLSPLLSEVGSVAGPASLDLRLGHGPEGIDLQGEGRIEGARLTLKTPQLVVSNVKGALRASGSRVELAGWTGDVGDGRLEAAGPIRFTDDGIGVDLTLRASDVPLQYPEGMRSRITGEARLAGSEGRFRLSGDVRVQRALYQRETDRSSQAIDSVAAELAALDQQGSPLERVQLDVRITLEDGLRIENGQASLAVDGGFTIGGDMLTPTVSGAVTLREGGTVKLRRARLRLTQGRVELAGYPERPPQLDVSGVTQVSGVQIEAELKGPLDDFRMSLASPNRSDLTQGDLATLILTGRTAQAAASSSGAILAEELAVALGDALDRQLKGAVFVDVSPDDSLLLLDETDPTQRFNIGVPVGERLYVIYSNALDGSGQRLILDVRPGFGVRIRAIGEEDESHTFEISQRLNFNLWSHRGSSRAKLAAQPRVREVRIEGLPAEESTRLRKRVDLDAGDRFDFFKGEAAEARVREALVADGYLTASVEHDAHAVGEGRLDVVLTAQRGERIHIEWAGEDPGKRARARALEGWDAGTPVEDAAGALARALQRELRAQGHYRASVAAQVVLGPTEARVVFDVRLGPLGRAVELRYVGNASLPAASLTAALPPRNSPEFFALLEPENHARLTAALRLPYARAGFLEAKVAEPQQVLDARSGWLTVTIPIEEGRRAQVVALELPGALGAAGATPPALGLAVGEPFRIDAYVTDRGKIGSWYRAHGYPEARVVGVLEPAAGGLSVRFTADPGPQPAVREVRVAGSGKTRRGVVDAALMLGPGDRIEPKALAESRQNLTDTRVFRGVELRTEATGDPASRDLVVDLVDRPDLGLEYSLRYTTQGSGEVGGSPSNPEGGELQAAAALELPNPFGWAHRYRLYGLVGSERTTYGASFDAATFFGRRWRTQAFLYSDEDPEEEVPGYAQRIRGMTFQQTRRWKTEISEGRWRDSLRMQWGYAFKRVRYTELGGSGYVESDRAGLYDSIIGDTRDSLTDPRRGFFWSLGLEANLRVLGSAEDYLKSYGQLFVYVPVGKRLVWASGARLGLVPGSDPLLLIESRFKAGGATTVRGFDENSLGPQTTGGVALGGQASFVFNQELRFPLWRRLHAGVFYDAGNVWGLAGDLDLGDLRHSAGAGLRLMFPFGPVRLDWARVLDPREGEKRDRLVFTLGHAF